MTQARFEKYRAACDLVEDCLKEGSTPTWVPGPGNRTALPEAASRWRKDDGLGDGATVAVVAGDDLLRKLERLAAPPEVAPDGSAPRK